MNKTTIRNSAIYYSRSNKVRTKNSECECGNYMVEQEKSFEGFPNLIRTEPTLTKK